MMSLISRFSALLMFLTLPLFTPALHAAPEPVLKNILNVFDALTPEEAPFLAGLSYEERRYLIEIEDMPNGYMRLKGENWSERWAEIALFKKSSGGYVVGIAHTECAPTCDTFLSFVERQSGAWVNVTERVYPAMNQSEELRVYQLPRVGRVITVKRSGRFQQKTKTLAQFTWSGAQFIQAP